MSHLVDTIRIQYRGRLPTVCSTLIDMIAGKTLRTYLELKHTLKQAE